MLTTTFRMTQDQERELRATLARLLQEHRDLDAAIEALQNTPGSDILQIQRLKKRKLYLRELNARGRPVPSVGAAAW